MSTSALCSWTRLAMTKSAPAGHIGLLSATTTTATITKIQCPSFLSPYIKSLSWVDASSNKRERRTNQHILSHCCSKIYMHKCHLSVSVFYTKLDQTITEADGFRWCFLCWFENWNGGLCIQFNINSEWNTCIHYIYSTERHRRSYLPVAIKLFDESPICKGEG